MLFFLNDNIQHFKSGIEDAQIQRLHLFEKNNEPAKIVIRQYSNEFHMVTNEAQIDDHDLVNLFDYFQGTRIFPQQDITISDLNINPHWDRRPDGINYNYFHNGNRVLYVRRRNDSQKHIMNVQYFDHFGKLLKVSWYDNRGFISVEQIYDWDGNISTENYLRPDGSIAIQLNHLRNKRNKVVNSYHLMNYRGRDYQFANFDELTAFFYDQIVTDPNLVKGNEPVGIVVDRVYELGWSILHMKKRVYRYMQLHNNHVNDNNDIMHSALNYNYKWGLDHFKDWDGVITLTPQQKQDVTARFGKYNVPIFRIPSAIVPDKLLHAKHVPFSSCRKHYVVEVARLSPEKQQDHLIAAWPQVLKKVPDAKLDLWGYANDNFDQKLKKQIKDLSLEKSVHLRGYTNNVGKVDDQAQLMVLPTRYEGLSIALVEGQAHGLPEVANDVHYGPADVIIDGQDGILTKNGDIDGLAKTIIDLLTDTQKLAQFSENAYRDSERYSEKSVMNMWREIIDDMKQREAVK